jgi:hypothetical protein
VPALTLAVVLPPPLGSEVPAVTLSTLFELGLPPAITGTIALTSKARLAHPEHAAAPQTDAFEELNQLATTRHRPKGAWTGRL